MINMIARCGRTVQRSLISLYPLKLNYWPSIYNYSLSVRPNFSFGNKRYRSSSSLALRKKGKQQKQLLNKFQNQPQNQKIPEALLNSISAVSKEWKKNDKKFKYQNPYIQQSNQRQVMEQGLLAFLTSYVIRKYIFSNHFKKDGLCSIRRFLQELINKLNTNKNEQEGMLKQNIQQFYEAFEVGKGITLPSDIFNQDRFFEACDKGTDKYVFNVTSVTTEVFKFVNDVDRILVGDFGIGKSFAHALNSFLSHLIWKFLVLYKENANDLMKKQIKRHKQVFDYFHKLNSTNPQSVEELLVNFTRTRIQFFYELNPNKNEKFLIKSLIIQCPEIQIENDKLTHSDDIYMEKLALVLQKFQEQMRKHNKLQSYVFNIDQGNIYYRLMKQLKKDQIFVLQQQKLTEYRKANAIIKLNPQNKYKQLKLNLFQAQIMSNILRKIYTLNRKSIKLCCSQLAQTDIFSFKKQSYVLNEMFDPYQQACSQSQKRLTFSQQKNQIKSLEIWNTFLFQMQDKAFKTLQKPDYDLLIENWKQIKLESIIFSILTDKAQLQSKNDEIQMVKKFVWPQNMKHLAIRRLFTQDTNIKYHLSSLFQSLIGFKIKPLTQIDQDESKKVQLTQEKIQALKIKQSLRKFIPASFQLLKLILLQLRQVKYEQLFTSANIYRQQVTKLRQAFLVFLIEQFFNQQREHKNIDQLKIQIKEIRSFFQTISLSHQLEPQTNHFTQIQRAIIFQLLRQVRCNQQLQYRVQKFELVIQNPLRIFPQNQKKINTIEDLRQIYSKDLIKGLNELLKLTPRGLGNFVDTSINNFISTANQTVTIGRVFNIINSETLSFMSFNYKNSVKFNQFIKEIKKETSKLKVGQSVAYRPVIQDDITKQIKYNPSNKGFDFLIITRINSNQWEFLTFDISVNKDLNDIIKKLEKANNQFYLSNVQKNSQFRKEFIYKHVVICLQQIQQKILNKLSEDQKKNNSLKMPNKIDENYPYKLVSISFNDILIEENRDHYSKYIALKTILQYIRNRK